ncbi:MAG: hypothetical protein V1689_03470 [Pseudomonadota bacterium]
MGSPKDNFEANPNDRNLNDPKPLFAEFPMSLLAVLDIGTFGFRICFGFRYSDFEFIELKARAFLPFPEGDDKTCPR